MRFMSIYEGKADLCENIGIQKKPGGNHTFLRELVFLVEIWKKKIPFISLAIHCSVFERFLGLFII